MPIGANIYIYKKTLRLYGKERGDRQVRANAFRIISMFSAIKSDDCVDAPLPRQLSRWPPAQYTTPNKTMLV